MSMRIVLPLLLLLARVLYGVARAGTGGDGPTAAGDAAPRVWLLRHAEAGSSDDPVLTPAGTARADAWHAALGSPVLGRVYATDTRRSRATAGAIAADAGVAVDIYDPARPEALVRLLRERAEPAVVVAHSNTLNELALAMGADPGMAPIAHDEHDRVHAMPLAGSATAKPQPVPATSTAAPDPR